MAVESDIQKNIYTFILTNRAAALATVSPEGIPHVATVYCVLNKDLSLYFMTRVEARKFVNLTNQPKIAMAFTNEPQLQTVQLTGIAERIDDLEIEQAVWHDLMQFRIPTNGQKPVPAIQLFQKGSTNEIAIIKVTPIEMTFANFDLQPDGRYKSFFKKVL